MLFLDVYQRGTSISVGVGFWEVVVSLQLGELVESGNELHSHGGALPRSYSAHIFGNKPTSGDTLEAINRLGVAASCKKGLKPESPNQVGVFVVVLKMNISCQSNIVRLFCFTQIQPRSFARRAHRSNRAAREQFSD